MGYQQTLNQIAFNQIKKNVDIPDYHLMVGTAEELKRMAGTDDFETAFVTIVREDAV